ncbi:hypothetical protein B7P43_G09509 [Cryptotermes secundus]|nr:hypothetical protein B7P43_G09509 [Cryptotermes secundus]
MNGGIGQQCCTHMDISEADDRMKRFYGIIPREKQQEIKTVRIVKRESERRQRDRDRSGNIGIPVTNGTAGGKRVTIVEDGDIATSQYPVEKQQLGCVLEEEPQDKQFSEELMAQEEDPVLAQFQRSMSLPRGFGKREHLGYQQQQVVPPLPPVRVPSPRSDSVTVLRNLMINRHRVRGSARSRDDLDMERALRPRLNAPDVVRSTMSHKDFKYNENTIDSILGTPNKIVIPERYIPEQAPELSAEEQMHRLKKAEAIRKMLSETTSITTSDSKEKEEEEQTSTLKKKVAAEKKEREHLLQLNQILAKQVMEKSKMVAGSTSVPSLE